MLFNIVDDEEERHDLSESHKDIFEAMRRLMAAEGTKKRFYHDWQSWPHCTTDVAACKKAADDHGGFEALYCTDDGENFRQDAPPPGFYPKDDHT